MDDQEERLYGPARLPLRALGARGRPKVVRDLAQHLAEALHHVTLLEAEVDRLRAAVEQHLATELQGDVAEEA